MRILYGHYLTDENHPAARMVSEIAKELRLLGHEVLVHASAGNGDAPDKATDSGNGRTSSEKGAGANRWLRQRLWFAKALYRCRKWAKQDRQVIRDFKPDVVIGRQDAYCWSLQQAAVRSKVPLVTYADAPVAYESRTFTQGGRWHPPLVVEWIEKWCIRNSRAVITVSNPAASQLDQYRIRRPIHVVPNGVELSTFPEPTLELRESVRRELKIETDLVIGFQGTFKAFHGIDRLKELIRATRERTDITWLLIGDGPERHALEQVVGRNERLKFLGRRKPEEMGRLLTSVDVAVAPHAIMKGNFYFCPLKILEYAAAGCAVLASNQGDIPLLLDGGNAGHIIPDNSLESWLAALTGMLDDDEYREEIRRHARSHIKNNLTWRCTAQKVEHILCDALGLAPPNFPDELDEDGSRELPISDQESVEVYA